jgi:hypothetical protein
MTFILALLVILILLTEVGTKSFLDTLQLGCPLGLLKAEWTAAIQKRELTYPNSLTVSCAIREIARIVLIVESVL